MKRSFHFYSRLFWVGWMVCIIGHRASAQTFIGNNLYTQNWFSIHPAYAGHHERPSLSLQARQGKLATGDNHNSSMLTFDTKAGENIGLGATILTSNQSGFESIAVKGTTAYTTMLTPNQQLTFGIFAWHQSKTVSIQRL